MANQQPTIRIGIYGEDSSTIQERHGCGLWAAGVGSCLQAAEATAVRLTNTSSRSWDQLLAGLNGLVLTGHDTGRQTAAEAESLCSWCHKNGLPLLAIDHGMHWLNTTHGGTVYFDLAREVPEALQHRHPPERGLRHAIEIVPKTHLATLYGEGEVVVNSEHRRAIQRVARGFRICARALDGVIEAVEHESDWFALGVQWQPASSTASGLDIQLFRGLVEACQRRANLPVSAGCSAA